MYMKHFKSKKQAPLGVSPLEVLQLIFIVLKFTGLVDWSWWAVISPSIAHLALLVVAAIIAIVWERRG